ncbi:hypothetical protein ACFX14_014380 [Malus domestica]
MLATLMAVTRQGVTVSFLEITWNLGALRNNEVSPAPALRLNIDRWHILQLPCLGSVVYFVIFIFLLHHHNYGVTVSTPLSLLLILFIKLVCDTLKLTTTMLERKWCTKS